ncbi:MFS transporter [Bifidobacterium sp. UTCIF-37]|uniref:MFS transporter n=1 Tax=Bifidobacterium callitrichos TaxID=762209 RepID=A0A2T3GAS8_9BIFI|nr:MULTISPECIES: MFS transporter [Bifidobacterium]PST46594.1 MFS transporter [Bifidobacterium callitrichos]TPF86840.1 MFS transporter [Bifidobacterium sp. UTCIF-37]TPF90468.1 MFS transporter [Bifidobacterium sp. UTCIF-38]
MSATAVAAATSEKKDSVPEIIAASMVGTAIEFYDNYCYSIASASYFGAIFFPAATKANPAIGTMLAFLTFAVSFLARPFGSMLFGHFGDKIGRKTTLVVALMTMGISTFLVGCLPSYDQLGILAIIILCICRACQGVGLAGEWSGAALVATENAPANKRALYGSFPNLGAPIGFFCAYGLNLLLDSTLGPDKMQAWGWRIPFLCSAVLVAIGLYVRLRMTETPIFRKAVENDRVVKHPLRALVPYWKEVLLGTFAMGITYTLFYVLGTWSLSYGVKVMKPAFTQNEYLAMQMTSVVFFAIFILISCIYSDRIGRKKVLITTTALTLVFSLFAMHLLQHNVVTVMIFLCVGFALMGGLFGPCGAYLPELFPTNVRYSGAGLSYNLAAILGGAFAPTIATALVQSTGSVVSVGWYMAIMAALALIALFLIKESKDKDYEE